MLKKVSQSQKEKYCMTPLRCGTWHSPHHGNGKGNAGCQGLRGGGSGRHCVIGPECQFRKTKRVPELDGGAGSIRHVPEPLNHTCENDQDCTFYTVYILITT